MGYRELLEALEAEVGRRIRELDEEAGRESRRLLEETRPQLAAERAAALAREGRRLDEEASRAVGRARVEEERTLLAEQWRLMAELRREAEARLSALSDAALLTRLVDELAPELGEGPLEFRVEEGQEEHLESHLARRHPELLRRATIAGSPDVHGGVQVSLGGRQRLDNTLPSRLEKAWPLLEGEVAARLFGEGEGDGGS